VFIHETKFTSKKTGKVHVQHKLVESIRTEKGPRHRVIMCLGTLTLPRIQWKRLAHALECQITGQQSLLGAHDADIERLALNLVSNHELSKARIKPLLDTPKSSDRPKATILLDSIRKRDELGIGAELLCMKAWEMLGFEGILRKLRINTVGVAVTMALLFGRMISPGSERHTIEWFLERSALKEFPGLPTKYSKNKFYETADVLYKHKDKIEDALFQNERKIFLHSEATIFLYDLTNTYLEGHGLNNALAERGHCKSKRYDLPLIALSLVVDDNGMPVCSQIYKGNQSEPETMETMMKRLSARLYGDQQIPMVKPTVAMDRGIATDDNVKWLRKNGYHYIVIKREDGCEEYRNLFETERDTFELVSSKKGIYGEDNNVYIHKEPVDGGMTRVLCFSEGKARKEMAIAARKKNPFVGDIKSLNRSIKKGSIKKAGTIQGKLERLINKHGKIAAKYEASVVTVEGKITGVMLTKKPDVVEKDPLYGCYVIESSHTELSAERLWKLYMTLSRVESAFRSMKEALGMRPVYHQTADRSASHLFITVLAYHLLAAIENILTQRGDTRTWGTIRNVMSTLQHGTVSMQTEDGASYDVRMTAVPTAKQQDIIDKFGARCKLDATITKINDL